MLAVNPSARSAAAFTYDALRGVVVMFGGLSVSGRTSDVWWEFDGTTWRERTATVLPSPRHRAAMTYNPRSRQVILFGGNTSSGYSNDTWLFDGVTWTLAQPVDKPPARAGHAMVYDEKHNAVVVHGGQNAAGTTLGDMWQFDGVNWSQRLDAQTPARWGHSLTYDARRERLLLFGGRLGAAQSAELWANDGGQWTLQIVTSGPLARYQHVAAFDVLRDRLVIAGGTSTDGTRNDVWEFDGKAWARVVATAPRPRTAGMMVYQPVLQQMVLFGGTQNGQYFDDTWLLAFDDNYAPERCLAGLLDEDADDRFGCGGYADDPATAVNESALRADPDCWARCTPLCPPWLTAQDTVNNQTVTWPQACALVRAGAPSCGDGTCGAVEDVVLCPQDCAAR